MDDLQEKQYMSSPRTLAGLPPELRLAIWDLVFQSITISIERGPKRTEESVTELERDGDGLQISIRNSATRAMSAQPSTPDDVLAVKLVCRAFAAEIGRHWHSIVTYDFPSTVAFVDVLSQWPEERIRTLRYVYVCDTPFPLFPYDQPHCYHTHDFANALPMFPGLELENLTVENIWLFPNGKAVDGWCEIATFVAMGSLLCTKGWRNLHYESGILPLVPSQQREIEEIVEKEMSERGEHDFEFGFGRIRPRFALFTGGPNGVPIRNETAVAEMEKWYAEHPEEGVHGEYPSDVSELHVALWARRGAKVNYAEDGSTLAPGIKGLLSHMSWAELRETNDYLVSDGLDDPTAHL